MYSFIEIATYVILAIISGALMAGLALGAAAIIAMVGEIVRGEA